MSGEGLLGTDLVWFSFLVYAAFPKYLDKKKNLAIVVLKGLHVHLCKLEMHNQ